MISAAIVTYNEADKLKECLKSISDLVDEVVIVDLGSTDNLDEIIDKFEYGLTKGKTIKKITHERVPYVEPVRQFSIESCKGDWILVLDPDESVSKELGMELKRISSEQSFSADAVNLPTKNIFFGRWIAHTNFWPDRHLRFFKKGQVRWGKKIHSYPKVSGEIYDLPADEKMGLLHYGYANRKQFITKQNRYADVEAQNRLAEGKHFSLRLLFWMPMREFLGRFIKHKGYLDGFNGIFLVAVLMYYQVMVQLNMLRYAKNYKRYEATSR